MLKLFPLGGGCGAWLGGQRLGPDDGLFDLGPLQLAPELALRRQLLKGGDCSDVRGDPATLEAQWMVLAPVPMDAGRSGTTLFGVCSSSHLREMTAADPERALRLLTALPQTPENVQVSRAVTCSEEPILASLDIRLGLDPANLAPAMMAAATSDPTTRLTT